MFELPDGSTVVTSDFTQGLPPGTTVTSSDSLTLPEQFGGQTVSLEFALNPDLSQL